MSSTNKTTNYELSQFTGGDKPAWLADYNQDMSKIDTQMKANDDAATGADGKATTNATNIGDLTYLSTTAKNNLVAAINEIDGNADTAQNTANSAATTAIQAKNKSDALEAYLTLNNETSVTFTASAGSFEANKNAIATRTNASKSLGKIYGELVLLNIPSGLSQITITSSDTGIRPSTPITFNGCGATRIHSGTTGHYRMVTQSYTLNTNGTITATLLASDAVDIVVNFWAVLLFITDFGDVPVTPE